MAESRQPLLDLLKWLALITMTLDHLRFAWPQLEPLTLPGRVAFPAFAIVIAAHAMRQGAPGPAAWRQLALLLGFALVSQWPYWLATGFEQGNIMLTLACGLSLICGLQLPGWRGVALAVAALSLPLAVPVSYGLPGVLLPGAFLLALHSKNRALWLLPASLAAIPQMGGVAQPAIAFAAALALLALLRAPWKARPWPVGRWAYAYYPAHLAALATLTH